MVPASTISGARSHKSWVTAVRGGLEIKSGIQEEVLHKMTQQQAIAEMQAVGLVWVETRHFLPTQHFMVFEKPDRPASH